MRPYQFTIPASGQDSRAVIGDFIRIDSATVTLKVILEDEDGVMVADLLMTQGRSVALPVDFSNVRVSNPSGGATTATLEIGRGNISDNELTGTITASRGATLSNAAHTVGVAAAELLAADSTRRSIVIQNLSASDIYLGNDSGVLTTNGLKVGPTQSLTVDKAPEAAIFAIGSAAALDVRTFTESD